MCKKGASQRESLDERQVDLVEVEVPPKSDEQLAFEELDEELRTLWAMFKDRIPEGDRELIPGAFGAAEERSADGRWAYATEALHIVEMELYPALNKIEEDAQDAEGSPRVLTGEQLVVEFGGRQPNQDVRVFGKVVRRMSVAYKATMAALDEYDEMYKLLQGGRAGADTSGEVYANLEESLQGIIEGARAYLAKHRGSRRRREELQVMRKVIADAEKELRLITRCKEDDSLEASGVTVGQAMKAAEDAEIRETFPIPVMVGFLDEVELPIEDLRDLGVLLRANETQRTQLETVLEGGEGAAAAAQGLLGADNPVARLILDKPAILRVVLRLLPDDADTNAALESLEESLIAAPDDILHPYGLTQGAHAEFYKKRTEVSQAMLSARLDEWPLAEDERFDALRAMKPEDYWRLLIDGKAQHHDNKHFYDRSQGYMGAMMRSFDKVVADIGNGEPLTPEWLTGLHHSACALVTNEIKGPLMIGVSEEDAPRCKLRPGDFQEKGHFKHAPNGWGMQINPGPDMVGRQELVDLQGSLERVLEEEPALEPRPYFSEDDGFRRDDGTRVMWKAGRAGATPQQLEAQVQRLLAHAIKTCQDAIDAADRKSKLADDHLDYLDAEGLEDAKLDAIVDCCRTMGMVHPFRDANGRLMMFLVLNRLLLENGLKPTILRDQGAMVGQRKSNLKALIKQGQGAGNPPDEGEEMGSEHYLGVGSLTEEEG